MNAMNLRYGMRIKSAKQKFHLLCCHGKSVTRHGVGVHLMKNWQGIPTTRLTLGDEVMVPPDNSPLAFSTELLNYIIPFATQGKSGHYKIFDG